MNFILSLIQLITIIIIVLTEYKNSSIVMYLWATLLLMFGLPHFVAVVTQTFIYSESVYMKASLFVIMFNGIYVIFRYISRGLVGKHNVIDNIRLEEKKTVAIKTLNKIGRRVLITLVFFFVLSIYSLVLKYGSVFSTSWGMLYSDSINAYSLGFNLDTIRFFANYIIILSGGLIPYYYFNKKYSKSIIVATLILTFGIITRNRILILPFVVSLILLFIIKYKRLNLKKMCMLGLMGLAAIYFVYALVVFRHYGSIATFLSTVDFKTFNSRVFEMILNSEGELGLRNVFLYFMDNNNNFPNFNKGHTYIRLLFILVPTRLSLGLKPTDFAISMGSAWRGNFANTTFSTHPTLYGDVFANLFWAGIILAIFWAVFATLIDKFVERTSKNIIEKYCYISIFGTMYVIIGRGSVYNAIFSAMISVIILKILSLIYRKMPKIKIFSR